MTPQTKEILLGQLRTWAAMAGGAIATGAATHGLINGASAANIGGIIAGLIVTAVCSLYSWWDKTGRDTIGAIISAQLEVLKAKSLAQANAMKAKGLPPVTVKQIADASAASTTIATMTPAEVTKAVATLPGDVAANVAPTPKITAA